MTSVSLFDWKIDPCRTVRRAASGVDQVAVVADRNLPCAQSNQNRLGVEQFALARGRVATWPMASGPGSPDNEDRRT